MATFLKAPEGVTSCSAGGEQYDVDDDGCIRVENGEHAVVLTERHGFTFSHNDGEEAPAPKPETDELGECPDFSSFANRGDLVAWLAANGAPGADADDSRADLEQACVDRHAALVAEAAETK